MDSRATWRWGFYFNLVIGAVFTPVYLLLVPSFTPRLDTSLQTRLRSFDYIGAILQAGLLVSGVMAINFGGTLYNWNSGQTIALFIVSGVLLIAFALQQKLALFTTIDARMFPVHFLRMKEPVLLSMLMAANNAATFVLIYYIPLYFQFTRGTSSLSSGVRLLPLIIAITVTIMVNGGVLSKTGYYQPWYVFGSVLVTIGGVLICKSANSFPRNRLQFPVPTLILDLLVARITIETTAAHVYGYEVLLGVGVGSYLQAGYAVVQGVLDPSHRSYAVTFILLGKRLRCLAPEAFLTSMIGQLLGIILGLSISGATFVNTTIDALQPILPNVSRQQLQSAISGTSGNFFIYLDPKVQERCLTVIMTSLQKM